MSSLFYGVRSNSRKFAALAVLSIVIMSLDYRQHHLDQVRSVLLDALYPIHYLVDLPSRAWNSLRDNLSGYRRLVAENQHFREELSQLRLDLLKYETLVAENIRLSQLLDSVSDATVPGRYLIARVLKVGTDTNTQLIQINKGSRHRIYPGQPLLDAYGIVGQVTHVGYQTSQALLITDRNHSIPLRINRTGVRTVAVGSGDDQVLELPYLPKNVDLREGDLLITSGLGGVFPAGYPVARVIHLQNDESSPFATVRAAPTAHIDRLYKILLVWPHENPPGHSLESDASPFPGDAG